MNDIVLSAGVRSNLLQLQNTADLIGQTQTRLATGQKVNSALDNPINFFTASSLNARAGDLGNLLDSMGNAIKTIEAADNALTAITNTVESLQSTVRQAQQDNSFKSKSFALSDSRTGSLSISGGSLTAAETIALSGTGTQSTVSASAVYQAPTAATAGTTNLTYDATQQGVAFAAGDTITFDLSVDGGATQNITINQAAVSAVGNNDNAIDSQAELISILNNLTTGATFADAGGGVTSVTSDTTGATSSVAITNVDADADAGGSINGTSNAFGITSASGTGAAAVDRVISISSTVGSTTDTANITLTSGNASTAALARAEIAAQLTAQGVSGITVGGAGNNIDLAGLADGSNSISIGGANVDDVFGAAAVTVAGASPLQSVDQLVTAITNNANLAAAGVVAENDDGSLKITFESTSATALSVTGVNTAGTEITGGGTSTTIEGNSVRRNLETQYNELRTQLNSLAEDASFNGINLLEGDLLEVVFNEGNTSSLTIQSTNTDGVNTTTLGITQVTAGDFASSSTLDARLTGLQDSLGTLRSQASAFGSNLSIVENREEFTMATINTLQSGADNLTLADLNEEGANLLALQTRQQLSTTALSLAAQADQNVLRLF